MANAELGEMTSVRLGLIGDVGATNARFALVHADGTAQMRGRRIDLGQGVHGEAP